MFVWGFKEVFWPIFKQFLSTIMDAIKETVKKHPFGSTAGLLGGAFITSPIATLKGLAGIAGGAGKIGAGLAGAGAGLSGGTAVGLGALGAISYMITTWVLRKTGLMSKITNWAAGKTKIYSETPDQTRERWGAYKGAEEFTYPAPLIKRKWDVYKRAEEFAYPEPKPLGLSWGYFRRNVENISVPKSTPTTPKVPWKEGYESEYARKFTLLSFGLPMEKQLFQMRMQALQRDIFEIWGPKEGKRMFAEEAQEKQAEFTEKVMGKWQELLTAQGVTAKDRAMIFQNLFKLAAPTGDIGKAETYYQKAMEELKKSFLKSAEKEKEKEKLDKERNETLNKVEKHLDNMQKSMRQKPPQNKDMEKPDTTDQEDV